MYAARITKEAVFWTDRRIIESGRNGMSQLDLSILVGQKPCLCSLQNAEFPPLEPCRMLAADDSFAACLDTGHAHSFVLEKGIEEADRIASSSDTGNKEIWKSLLAC